jgi:hypothetical protein
MFHGSDHPSMQRDDKGILPYKNNNLMYRIKLSISCIGTHVGFVVFSVPPMGQVHHSYRGCWVTALVYSSAVKTCVTEPS